MRVILRFSGLLLVSRVVLMKATHLIGGNLWPLVGLVNGIFNRHPIKRGGGAGQCYAQ